VKYEWTEAIERSKEIAADDAFIFPVSVGEVSADDPSIPPEIRAVQWTPLAAGALDESFFDMINRSMRRKLQGGRR